MKSHSIVAPSLLFAALSAGLVTSATAQVARTPNLTPLPASNFSLVTNANGTLSLRFNTTSWNNGTGPFQLEAGPVDTGNGKQQVFQRVFNTDGTSALFFAGWFEWHNGHNHFHFDDYALYTLQPVNAPGASARTGAKTTFCVMDTTKINGSLLGAPTNAGYSTCGNQIQGMSVGWGDTYGSHLAGQELDFTDNPNGIYQVRIEVDPKKVMIESNKNDNVSCALISVTRPSTVNVLDASGSCSTVASISPTSAAAGTSVQVTITGYGFSAGVPVSFEGGNGPRPVASNVQLVTDTEGLDTLTATITVPYKKQIGKDPVWDLRVGSGGLLRNAFTVTR
jgi:hypothetical protein